jgi:hypothetical protein
LSSFHFDGAQMFGEAMGELYHDMTDGTPDPDLGFMKK